MQRVRPKEKKSGARCDAMKGTPAATTRSERVKGKGKRVRAGASVTVTVMAWMIAIAGTSGPHDGK
jgi:hypothetical protein